MTSLISYVPSRYGQGTLHTSASVPLLSLATQLELLLLLLLLLAYSCSRVETLSIHPASVPSLDPSSLVLSRA